MYVAKCYVRLKDYTARPGEVFGDALEKETARRLLKLGAIEELKIPAPGRTRSGTGEDTGEQEPPAQEPPVQDPPEQEPLPADEEETAGEEAPTPPPVIDAMDGISGGKKSGGKKK